MADVTASRIIIDIRTNADKATKDLDGLDKKVKETGKSTQTTTKSFSGLGGVLAGGVIVAAATTITKRLIQTASAAEEVQNKFSVTFSSISNQANQTAATLAKSFGLASFEAQKLLANTGDLLTGFSFSQKEALELSNEVQRLAGDLGSFNDIPIEQASKAITSALFGEREAVKQLGIVIRETDLQQRLAAKGLDKLTGSALLQAKAVETLAMATEQSRNAQGDFARSSGSVANVIRRVQSTIKDLEVVIGSALLPVVAAIGEAFIELATLVRPAIEVISNTIKALANVFAIVIKIVVDFVKTALGPLFKGIEEGKTGFNAWEIILNKIAQVLKFIAPVFKFLAKQLSVFAIIAVNGMKQIFGFFAKMYASMTAGIAELAIKFRQLANTLEDSGVISVETAKKFRVLSNDIVKAAGYQTRYINGKLVAVKAEKDFSDKVNKTTGNLGNLTTTTQAAAKATENYLQILANAGDISAQLELLNQKYIEQKAIVEKAGADATALDKFYQSQRQQQLEQYFSAIIQNEKLSFAQREQALNSSYQSLLESDNLSYESRLEAQRVFTEQSQALEQARLQSIADATQQAAGIATAGLNVFQKVSDLQTALAEREIEKLKARGATEEEIEQKRRELAREQAKRTKKIGIITALINTAVGVTQALASAPPPFSFVLAALVAAAGAIEVAAISSTPIPAGQFGLEGIVPPGASADSGLVRVNQGERVAVTPARFSGQNAGGGGGFPKQFILMVDGQQFNAYLVDKMNKNLNNGKVQIRRKGVVKAS